MDRYDEFLKGLSETPTQPAVEPLWSVQQGTHTVSCVLRYHGPQYGVEVQILYEAASFGSVSASRRRSWRSSGPNQSGSR